MSASLVGSEMCIRDSKTLLPPWAGPCEPGCHWPTLVGIGPPPHGAAVSYTHLTLPTICSV
eukprot:11708236-Alexandrium_andersonii.AAC.1